MIRAVRRVGVGHARLARRHMSTAADKSGLLPDWFVSPAFIGGMVGLVFIQRMFGQPSKHGRLADVKPGITDADYKPPHERAAAKAALAEKKASSEGAPIVAVASEDLTSAVPSEDLTAAAPAPPAPDTPVAAAPAPSAPDAPVAAAPAPPAPDATAAPAAPTPAGPVVTYGDLSAFSDGSSVWLRKRAAHGPLDCNLTESQPTAAPPKVLGFTHGGGWLLTSAGSSLTAFPIGGANPVQILAPTPNNKTPPKLGAVFFPEAQDVVLLEVEGLVPGATPAIYRLELPPAADSANRPAPLLALDTTAPLSAQGAPAAWLVDESSASVLGVLMKTASGVGGGGGGAGGGTSTLLMRSADQARHGGELWQATCER